MELSEILCGSTIRSKNVLCCSLWKEGRNTAINQNYDQINGGKRNLKEICQRWIKNVFIGFPAIFIFEHSKYVSSASHVASVYPAIQEKKYEQTNHLKLRTVIWIRCFTRRTHLLAGTKSFGFHQKDDQSWHWNFHTYGKIFFLTAMMMANTLRHL